MSDWSQTLVGSGAVLVGVAVSQVVVWRTDRARARREDAARSYEQRRTVYVDFVRAVHDHLSHWDRALREASAPDDAMDVLFRLLAEVEMFGGAATSKLAGEVLEHVRTFTFTSRDGDVAGALGRFVAQARTDLQVPS